MIKITNKFPLILLISYLLFFILLALHPIDRDIWLAQNIPVIILIISLLLTYKIFKFSNTSYIFFSIFIILQTIGGHYTFEKISFNFLFNTWGQGSYQYIIDFSIGFLAYPMCEYIYKEKLSSSKWMTYLFGIFFIISLATVFDLIEWFYALYVDDPTVAYYLCTHGYIYQMQKDLSAYSLGSVFSATIFLMQYYNKFNNKEK